MLTKQDFLDAAFANIGNYPALETLYRAGDPRITQHIGAVATMLAMMSAQIEVSQAEPFERVRDSTVLADAALKGIFRKARPGRVCVTVENKGNSPLSLSAGRNLYDTKGNLYRIDTPVVVSAASSATVDCTQIRLEEITHTVSGSVPFYAIEIPESDDGSFLSAIEVRDSDGDFTYSQRYVNIDVGEKVFHVETDDRRRTYVRFGQSGVVGYQPPDGSVITLRIYRSIGRLDIGAGSPFSFEYSMSPLESQAVLSLHSVLDAGQNPIEIEVLRDLAKYPSVYDPNAVYLGEFEFLVRKHYSDAQFLSIWNENREEAARGASVDNINVLFVAVMSAAGGETVLTESNPLSPVSPQVVTSLTTTQQAIKNLILDADDSYKVKFFTSVKSKIVMSVSATVSTAYTESEVETQIIDRILSEYGISSKVARRGGLRLNYQDVYRLLRKHVAALADAGADLQVSITPYAGPMRPELWRYVAADSLTVTVTRENIGVSGWS